MDRTEDMHRNVAAILSLILLTGCAASIGPVDGTVGTAESDSPTAGPIESAAAEFRRLRAIKGHFEGGDWNEDVDKWMGHKHQLMIQIAANLGTGEYSRAEIIKWLDPPDSVAGEGDEFFDLVSGQAGFDEPAAGSYELLIYYWRGTHDFLYFTAQGEAIVSSGWWYAGD